jgi:hypothetical protein
MSISALSFYFRGTYGQNFKLAKKPRTLVLRIFATVEKSAQNLNTVWSFSVNFKLYMIFNIEKCCPEVKKCSGYDLRVQNISTRPYSGSNYSHTE